MVTTPKRKLRKLNIAERMVPEFHAGTSIYGEHYIRYEAALSLVKGKTVLDIASGSGYGSKLLSTSAKKVYGVDVSEEAIAYSGEEFAAKNIEYKVGDGERIPLKDNSVEVVVSFETIEHLKDYKNFLKEIRRVLKPDGLLILSTPNELEFAEGNHYHLHEFEEGELKQLVSENFKYTKSYYQGDWVYSALLPKELISEEFTSMQLKTFNFAPLNPKNYLYFYMLCSNRKITEKLEPVGALSQHWSERSIQTVETERKRISNLTNDHVKNLESIIAEQKARIEKLTRSSVRHQPARAWRFAKKTINLSSATKEKKTDD